MSQKTKLIAAICIVALIPIILIVVLLIKPQPETYSLDATAKDGKGMVIKDPNQTSYKDGDEVTLKAVPKTGYRFDKWSGDLSGSNDTTKLVMDSDKTVTANFVLKTYSLTVEVEDGSVKVRAVDGSVVEDANQASFRRGAEVTLEAIPIEGYSFKNWSGDLSGSTNPATLVMDEEKSVTASFTLKPPKRDPVIVPNLVKRELIEVRQILQKNRLHLGRENEHETEQQPEGTITQQEPKAGTMSTVDTPVNVWVAIKPRTRVPNLVKRELIEVRQILQKNRLQLGQVYKVKTEPGQENTIIRQSPRPGEVVSIGTPVNVWVAIMEATRQPKQGDIETNSIGMKLVYIPTGEFMMGSSVSAQQLANEYDKEMEDFVDEFPRHQVHISEGFWMGQTEVTQGQYESVMKAKPWSGKSFVQEDANCPAVYVKWEDVNDFCSKLSHQEGKKYRLPTEAEWEYACRAGKTSRFDSSLDGYPWFWDNTYEVCLDCAAHLVRQKEPNPWGLYDMHGNVREWCSDWYAKEYDSNSPDVDPKGPLNGSVHVVRGGSYANTKAYLRYSCRDGYDPDVGRSSVGFRVVCEE